MGATKRRIESIGVTVGGSIINTPPSFQKGVCGRFLERVLYGSKDQRRGTGKKGQKGVLKRSTKNRALRGRESAEGGDSPDWT